MEWLKKELSSAADKDSGVNGVVLLLSIDWKSNKVFSSAHREKERLSEHIRSLGFNTKTSNKWLVMV